MKPLSVEENYNLLERRERAEPRPLSCGDLLKHEATGVRYLLAQVPDDPHQVRLSSLGGLSHWGLSQRVRDVEALTRREAVELIGEDDWNRFVLLGQACDLIKDTEE